MTRHEAQKIILSILFATIIITTSIPLNPLAGTAEAATTSTYKVVLRNAVGGKYDSASNRYVAGTYLIPIGTTIYFGAVPNTGYVFDHWAVQISYNGLGTKWDSTLTYTKNPQNLMSNSVNRLFQITPVYKAKTVATYTLTMLIPQGQGTVTPKATTSYPSGTKVNIVATPSAGWQFDYWTIDGSMTSGGATSSVTIDANKSIQAFFRKISVSYTLTMLTFQGQGSVTPAPGATTYPSNTQVSIRAAPSNGWEFDHWTLNGVQTDWTPTKTLTMTSDNILQAFFKQTLASPPTQITPLIDTILEKSPQTIIDGLNSGWTATYGTITYNTNDFVTSPASLLGTPRTTGPERLKFQKTFVTPIDLTNSNIGFWIKTTGAIPSDLTFYLEAWDNTKLATNYRQWRYITQGDPLVGSDATWSHHFVLSDTYNSETPIDMTKITKLVFRFISPTSSDWTISIDDLRAFPNPNLFPNGAVILTFDGPYPHQIDWAYPIMQKYGYNGVIATSKDAGDNTVKPQLAQLYASGWDIVVYARMFDNSTTPQHLSETQILNYVITQQQWLNSLGYTRSSAFLQCNRHLTNVYTDTLLSKYFYFVKGNHWLASTSTKFPTTALTGVSLVPENDLARLQSAHDNGELFIFFNHLNNNSPVDYTKEQFTTFIDKIHSLGMEVITYSQLLERYQNYLAAQP
jgi:hypothetical protein